MHEPVRRAGPAGEISDQFHTAPHRDVLVDQQVHHQRAQIHPITARRRRHPGGQRGDMLASARTADPVHVVLAHRDADLGEIMGLVGAFDAHLGGLGQIRPTPAGAVRAVRHALIGDRHPRQRTARRTGLLAPLAPRGLHRLGLRFAPPRKIIRRGWHRGVPAVAAHDPFQRRDPLNQPRVRRGQLLDRLRLRSDHHVPRRARPALRRKRQRLGHPGMITTAQT